MIGGMSPDAPLSFAAKPTLTGERVLLRPVRESDAEGLVELITDPEVRRLTGTHRPPGPDPLAEARRWYGSRAGHDDRLDLAILERSGGGYAGEVVLNDLDPDNRSCSLRIALAAPRLFGRGYGSEAVRLVLGHAFETVGVHRIALEVFDFNARARRVYEKAGFRHEGTHRQALRWDGRWHDTHTMAVLAPDWPPRAG